MSENKIIAVGLGAWAVVVVAAVVLTIMVHGCDGTPAAAPAPPDTLPLFQLPPAALPPVMPPAMGPMACPCPADMPPLPCTSSADCVARGGCCAWLSTDPLLTYCVAAPNPLCD